MKKLSLIIKENIEVKKDNLNSKSSSIKKLSRKKSVQKKEISKNIKTGSLVFWTGSKRK